MTQPTDGNRCPGVFAVPTASGVGGIAEEPLAMISTYLRGDRNLSPTAAGALEQIIKITYDQLRNKD